MKTSNWLKSSPDFQSAQQTASAFQLSPAFRSIFYNSGNNGSSNNTRSGAG
jgi:hypothetical protein